MAIKNLLRTFQTALSTQPYHVFHLQRRQFRTPLCLIMGSILSSSFVFGFSNSICFSKTSSLLLFSSSCCCILSSLSCVFPSLSYFSLSPSCHPFLYALFPTFLLFPVFLSPLSPLFLYFLSSSFQSYKLCPSRLYSFPNLTIVLYL